MSVEIKATIPMKSIKKPALLEKGDSLMIGLSKGNGGLRALLAVGAVGVLGAGVVAGCGGSSDTSSASGSNAAASGGGGTSLNLVGYSTPKKAYDALTSAFAQTSGGKG